jgi:hypothetical protein
MAQLEKLKLTASVWDSDKEPQGFSSWLDTFSSLVRATDAGGALEDFITYKTGREVFQEANVPSFLISDPDFDMPRQTGAASDGLAGIFDSVSTSNVPASAAQKEPDPEASPLQKRRAAAAQKRGIFVDAEQVGSFMADVDSLRTGVSKRTLKKAPRTYMDLPQASRTLDGLLYNVLKMVIKGSKAALLMCVMFPSYVQAVCVLVNHMDISKYDRITRSIFELDKLTYTGDVHAFQVTAMNVIREVRASKANMTHLILTRLMKSFEGKSKTVQYKIAEIINSGVEIDETLNLFDIIQSLCSDIATVGDTKAAVNSVTEEAVCDFCSFKHKTSECRKLKEQKKLLTEGRIDSLPKKAPARSFKGDCHNCGRIGHVAAKCPASKDIVSEVLALPAPAVAAHVFVR